MKPIENIIIIGGGLSGLTLAYLLSKQNICATILEASPRLGGRIQTVMGKQGTPLELGATWFSDLHPNLLALLDDLELKKFPQYAKGKSLFQTKSFEPPQEFYIPETETPSYRVAGGTQSIINALSDTLKPETIKLNTKVISVTEIDSELVVETNTGTNYTAAKVVLCVPPQLVSSQIKFSPKLPDAVSTILPTVQTWMGGAIKFVLEYANPFWRTQGYSGMLYSHSGIVSEMYDHTNVETTKFGFTGFLNGGSSSYTKDIRKELVLKQLSTLLGPYASNPLAYYEKIWTDEFILDGNQIVHRPHQNNGHPTLQNQYMNGKLMFSGTEAMPEFSGYMEGAVRAAINAYEKLVPHN
jgi:monoamine oxidase